MKKERRPVDPFAAPEVLVRWTYRQVLSLVGFIGP